MLEDLYSKSQERRQAIYRPCSHLSSLCIVSCLPCTHALQTTPGRCITSAGHASMHHLVLMKHEACDWMSHSHQMPDCFDSTASVIDNQCTSKEGSKLLDAKDHLTPNYLCASGTATPVVNMDPGQAHKDQQLSSDHFSPNPDMENQDRSTGI